MAKILYVEDNEMNRDMLSRRLQRRDHEILLAFDGKEGLDMMKSEKPDLVLMDMGLPVMDGWEATTTAKGDPEIKTFWKDPQFKKDQNTFYYARVLENPTCRWSTWDAIRAGEKPRQDIPATIQERAWSSPIWLSGS